MTCVAVATWLWRWHPSSCSSLEPQMGARAPSQPAAVQGEESSRLCPFSLFVHTCNTNFKYWHFPRLSDSLERCPPESRTANPVHEQHKRDFLLRSRMQVPISLAKALRTSFSAWPCVWAFLSPADWSDLNFRLLKDLIRG